MAKEASGAFAPTTAHAVYSMSSMFRWGAEDGCSASAQAIANMREVVPEEDSEDSATGTEAHDELERVMRPMERGETPLEVDPDHPAVIGIARLVHYAKQLPPGQFFIERHVRLTDEIWGRLDIGHWHVESATVTVADLKNGFVGVDAERNHQLRGYAAALIRTFNLPAKQIRYCVGQENDFRPNVPRVKQWVEPVADLLRFAARVSAIPNSPLTFRFGAHCRDCPLLGICEPTRDLLPHLGAAMALGPAGDVPPHLIPVFLALKKPIDHFFEGLLKNGAKRVLGGGTVPGMKMVTQLPNRSWRDEAEARAVVFAAKGLDALKPPTPAQAEAMGVEVGALATRGKGYPVLALEADPRPVWAPQSASEMFAAARREES